MFTYTVSKSATEHKKKLDTREHAGQHVTGVDSDYRLPIGKRPLLVCYLVTLGHCYSILVDKRPVTFI